MPVSAIKGVVRSYQRDGQHWDELSCGHRVTQPWSVIAKKHEPADRRFCRTCWDQIPPVERIPTEETLFAAMIAVGCLV